MTRARQTLALARFPGPHPLLESLRGTPSVLRRREPVNFPPAAPELARRYRRLSLRDVFLSFAGYRGPGHPVHRAIAALSPGDLLQVRVESDRWELLDRSGTVVGQLAGSFQASRRQPALRLCHGHGHRRLGSSAFGAGVQGPAPLRCLGSGGAGAGVRAGFVAGEAVRPIGWPTHSFRLQSTTLSVRSIRWRTAEVSGTGGRNAPLSTELYRIENLHAEVRLEV